MDEELRKAQRTFQRAFGGDELGILSLFYEQICDYLRQQKLPLIFGGVARDIWQLHQLHPEMMPCRNMVSKHIHFLHHADLDTKSPEEILKECCCHASWAEWFYLIAYHRAFVAKQQGTFLWGQVLAEDTGRSTDETTYQERLQASFDEWDQYAIVCLLENKYISENSKPEPWYNWSAQLLLVGYSTHKS